MGELIQLIEADGRESGKAAIIMGFIGITERAILFVAADPIRVIPSIMVAGAVGSVISLLLYVEKKNAQLITNKSSILLKNRAFVSIKHCIFVYIINQFLT